MRTVPVNHSAGPLPDGCVPFRLISIALSSGVGYLRMMQTPPSSVMKSRRFIALPMHPKFSFPLHQNRKVRQAKLGGGAAMCAAQIPSNLWAQSHLMEIKSLK
jgi:hypothetical protein